MPKTSVIFDPQPKYPRHSAFLVQAPPAQSLVPRSVCEGIVKNCLYKDSSGYNDCRLVRISLPEFHWSSAGLKCLSMAAQRAAWAGSWGRGSNWSGSCIAGGDDDPTMITELGLPARKKGLACPVGACLQVPALLVMFVVRLLGAKRSLGWC